MVLGDRDDVIDDVLVQIGRNKSGTDALDLVGAGAAAGQDRGDFRLHCHGQQMGIFLLDHFRHTGDGAARAHAGHKDIDVPVQGVPDFRTGGGPVDRGVGRVGELVRHPGVASCFNQVPGRLDGPFHSFLSRCEVQCRPQVGQKLPALDTHGFRHGQDQVQPLDPAHECQSNAGIAGGGFHDYRVRGDFSDFNAVVDHGQSDTVLDRGQRIEIFQLSVDVGPAGPAGFVQIDQGGVPAGRSDIRQFFHEGIPCVTGDVCKPVSAIP